MHECRGEHIAGNEGEECALKHLRLSVSVPFPSVCAMSAAARSETLIVRARDSRDGWLSCSRESDELK